LREEQERIRQEEEKLRARLRAKEEERIKQRLRVQELEDEQLEREMKEVAIKAALRPVEIDPDGWKYRKKAQYNQYTYQHNPTSSNYETIEDTISKKKKEKVQELLLSQPIKGELYIDGDKRTWRIVILNWLNENQLGESLVVSIRNVIDYMKSSGSTFNQNEKLVKYPIKDFLDFYEKTVKVELKKKINLTILD
jgi:hypothetical protein